MITQYIKAAMRGAQYELMENGRWFGDIPACPGCWADGANIEECREELAGALEAWILLGLQLGHTLPVIDGLNLNPQPEYAEAN
jgi:predicted RNase H-like HicB family nuclease